jgi:hypothetical protein
MIMPLYCFDKCPEDKLSEIEELALGLDLEPEKTIPPDRRWIGFSEGNIGFLYFIYSPTNPYCPFTIQTAP